MVFVTLTTDYGLRDHYLASLKGSILKEEPSLQLVDVSHDIENYNIVQAAYLFSNAWKSFPERSIHLLSINDYDFEKPQFLALHFQNHFFIGPDNGVFSLIFEKLPSPCHRIKLPLDTPNPLETAYAGAIGHLAKTGKLDGLGRRTKSIVKRISLQPVITPDMIQGSIIYLDNYDNAVTNISKALFEKVGNGRGFSLFFKRTDPIKRFVGHYHEAPLGGSLCRFNSAGFLEVAIHKGKAASLLGLGIEDTVQVVFDSNG